MKKQTRNNCVRITVLFILINLLLIINPFAVAAETSANPESLILDIGLEHAIMSRELADEEYVSYLPLFLKPGNMPGKNSICAVVGHVEICASVSDATPSQNAEVIVYGQLVINGVPQQGLAMHTTWHYKTTTSYCNSGVTNDKGIASCTRTIGMATIGHTVDIDVTIGGYCVSTSFTPAE